MEVHTNNITGIFDRNPDSRNELSVYPNPARGAFRLTAHSSYPGTVSLVITNMQGVVILKLTDQRTDASGNISITIPQGKLQPGVYSCSVTSDRFNASGNVVIMP